MNQHLDHEAIRKHHLHSPYKRGLYTLLLVVVVLTIGTIGLHRIEHFSYLDSFYFMSMIATGQGPAPVLIIQTAPGKIFVSFMAFISAGMMIAALGFLLGPFLGKLLHLGVFKFEKELQDLTKKH